jgi:hypothetical protein
MSPTLIFAAILFTIDFAIYLVLKWVYGEKHRTRRFPRRSPSVRA